MLSKTVTCLPISYHREPVTRDLTDFPSLAGQNALVHFPEMLR